MSKFNLLAVAVAASLAAPAAFALEVTPTAAHHNIAYVDVKDATSTVHVGEVAIKISDSDLIIGRTVGFSVRIDLEGGAEFAATVADPAVGAALPAPGAGVWTVTRAAGGTAGSNFVVFSVQPGADSTGVINGTALTFAASGIRLNKVAGLGTAGGSVSAKVTFADPGTAQPILTPVTQALVKSVNPLVYTVTGGDTTKKIDVGTTATTNSKTRFSPNGTIAHAAPERHFDAGTTTFGVTTGSAAARAVDAPADPFAWATTDEVSLTVGGSFSAFLATTPANSASVRLVTAGTCASPTTSVSGTVAAGSVTFPATAFSSLNSNTGILCFTAPSTNNVVIDATAISTQVTVTRKATSKTAAASGAALPMAYNGPVIDVDHFNPSSNANQVSYLRISNPSGAAGQVSISGVCDNGEAKSAVGLTLPAGQSILLTSAELENGAPAKGLATGLGACAVGKYRLTVTGEFNNMKVQNFLRNVTSGGMINTNVNNVN